MPRIIYTPSAYRHAKRADPIAWSMHRPGSLVVITVTRRA